MFPRRRLLLSVGAGAGQAFGKGPAAFLGSKVPEAITLKTPLIRLALMAVVLASPVMSPSAAGEPGRPDKKLKVVVFGGHPDDPESGTGGLVALLTRQGHEVICAYGTAYRGARRFFDRPEAEVRREEANAACKVLGATPKFFPYAHEKLTADEETLKAVSAWLDEVKPDVVVTHWPLDTHPNHHAVSSLVWQCYKRQGGWNLYFFEVMTGQQTITFEPDLYLDIGPVREVKKRALDEHRSQGPEDIWKAHETMHRRRGAECGVEAAETYKLVEAKPGCPSLPVTFLGKKPGSTSPAARGTDRPATNSESKRGEHGILVHAVESPYQAGETEIRVLPPDTPTKGTRYPVVYVLPVESRNERRYGDGLLEVRRHNLHNQLQAIFVAPTFSHLPWYADHPSDRLIRQESYFLKVVIPFVESHYPARAEPGGRLLLGFSKSGWGAFSLLLRHPDVFGRAAAWDAPLMMDRPGKYGSGDIFGTTENFETYRITGLLKSRAAVLGEGVRMVHMGYGNFRDDHEAFEALLKDLRVSHRYVDGPRRDHTWASGWVPEAAGMLFQDDENRGEGRR
jgi:LmbE family N-acetylglucosaminyl deacetylase